MFQLPSISSNRTPFIYAVKMHLVMRATLSALLALSASPVSGAHQTSAMAIVDAGGELYTPIGGSLGAFFTHSAMSNNNSNASEDRPAPTAVQSKISAELPKLFKTLQAANKTLAEVGEVVTIANRTSRSVLQEAVSATARTAAIMNVTRPLPVLKKAVATENGHEKIKKLTGNLVHLTEHFADKAARLNDQLANSVQDRVDEVSDANGKVVAAFTEAMVKVAALTGQDPSDVFGNETVSMSSSGFGWRDIWPFSLLTKREDNEVAEAKAAILGANVALHSALGKLAALNTSVIEETFALTVFPTGKMTKVFQSHCDLIGNAVSRLSSKRVSALQIDYLDGAFAAMAFDDLSTLDELDMTERSAMQVLTSDRKNDSATDPLVDDPSANSSMISLADPVVDALAALEAQNGSDINIDVGNLSVISNIAAHVLDGAMEAEKNGSVSGIMDDTSDYDIAAQVVDALVATQQGLERQLNQTDGFLGADDNVTTTKSTGENSTDSLDPKHSDTVNVSRVAAAAEAAASSNIVLDSSRNESQVAAAETAASSDDVAHKSQSNESQAVPEESPVSNHKVAAAEAAASSDDVALKSQSNESQAISEAVKKKTLSTEDVALEAISTACRGPALMMGPLRWKVIQDREPIIARIQLANRSLTALRNVSKRLARMVEWATSPASSHGNRTSKHHYESKRHNHSF